MPANEERLQELLKRWKNGYAQGREPRAEDLCPDSPDLQQETQRRIEKLHELLDRWDEAREHGKAIAPEELCRDHPELLMAFKELAGTLESVDSFLEAKAGDGPWAAPSPIGAVGRYRALGEGPVARGGLGEIWLARDEELWRQVALKYLQEACVRDADACRRFVLEAEITGRLEHPGVVPVYGLVHDGKGRPCYAMRFIHGQTLRDAIEQFHAADAAGPDTGERSVAFQKLLRSFLAVCQVLAYAHSRGIIHRDVKPGNIMLGRYGETLVVDWGLAKPMTTEKGTEAEPTETLVSPVSAATVEQSVMGFVKGSPAYMSPEQAEGQWDAVGVGADIYGLGATLYHLLTGRPPFTGDLPSVLGKVKRGDFQLPRRLNREIPGALEAICLKAMSLRPIDRYPTALDLAADVEHWLANEPVTAYVEPWSVKARRWLGRHQTLAAATVAAVLVATAALGAVTVLLQSANEREQRLRTTAEQNFQLARDAVDRYFTKVSESSELKAHGLEALRRELLGQAKDFYERFANDEAGGPGVQLERGNAYLRLARIHKRLGDHSAAEAFYGKGLAVFQALVQEDGRKPEYAEPLARGHEELGIVYADTGRLDQAEAEFRQTRDIEERLIRTDPARAEHRQLLATAYTDLGNVAYLTNRMDAAESAYGQALAIQEKLANEHADAPGYQAALAKTYTNLGNLYGDTRRPAKSEATYKQALKIQEILATRYGDDPEYQKTLAATNHNLAGLYLEAGETRKADPVYREALRIEETLLSKHPAVLEYAVDVGETYTDLGNLWQDSRLDDALAWYDKAIQTWRTVLAKEPQQRTAHVGLCNSLAGRAVVWARQGKYKPALQEADALAKEVELTGGNCYALGCAYARCSSLVTKDTELSQTEQRRRAEEHAARAVAMLRHALDKGYKPAARKMAEEDLKPLKDRADFKKFLGEARKAQPPADQ
jgi:tetratricopeptide (TPR) repeat protein/tRNA A-37 threonylcarbamoyl transferase component Bud32